MEEFIQYIDTQLQLEIKLSATGDPRRKEGLRNIKCDFIYLKDKNDKDTINDLIKKLYKSRKEASEIYKDVNNDLYMQEVIEMNILDPFLPEEINWQDVFTYLSSLEIEKDKKNFKSFQVECETHFGQKIDSKVILDYINS